MRDPVGDDIDQINIAALDDAPVVRIALRLHAQRAHLIHAGLQAILHNVADGHDVQILNRLDGLEQTQSAGAKADDRGAQCFLHGVILLIVQCKNGARPAIFRPRTPSFYQRSRTLSMIALSPF